MSLESLSPIYMESVSASTATPSVELGSRRTDSTGNEYIYVYNHGVETYPGRAVYLKTAASGYTVSVTNTAAQVGQYAGGVHHSTLLAASYGWIMTRGLCAVGPDTNEASFDAGEYITVGVDDGYVGVDNATMSTGSRLGWTISSGVTAEGTTFAADLGAAWIKSDIW